MKKIFLLLVIFSSLAVNAQIPDGYYDSAQGLTGENLRSALHDIIDGHSVVSYDGLWTAFKHTDNLGNNKVWDMYSNCNFTFGTDQCGEYKNICDCYNREHSFPKSWFNNAPPMKSDLFHLVPTDGKVNGYRSNYPYGECASGTTYGTGKLGTCTFPGYSSIVFEPANEYKGDFARIYFYMLTRYMDKISSWSSPALSGNNFSDWTRKLLLKWHENDPVSQKEIDRNNVIYKDYQHNRNPFVDNPEWAYAIWDPTYNTVDFFYKNITVFPVPASNNVSVNYPNELVLKNIEILDINGRVVLATENADEIDIQNIADGFYFMRINFQDSFVVKQIIISK
ncbi:MAG: T9SS type A sorting domain-containing protein [Bacteroidales bacterium]|nr:T9SS type A sorting domain-containing protein [Bacteroidales bacterium]